MGICEGGQQAVVYDANTHEVLHKIWGTGSITVEFTQDGSLVAISGIGNGITIWRTDSFRQNIGKKPSDFAQCHIQTHATPFNATLSPDGSLITYNGWRPQMASSGDNSVWFWDTQTCEVHLEVQVYLDDDAVPPSTADAVAYSPNGQYAIIASLADNQTLHLWDVMAGTDLGRLPDDLIAESIWGFSPDNQHLVLRNGTDAQIWHTESGTVTRTFTADAILRLDASSLVIMRDGDVYRITETDETLLWDDELPVTSLRFTDDKQWLIIGYDTPKTVLLDVAAQTVVYEWESYVMPKISPDKSKMAWADGDTVQLFDFVSEEQFKLNNYINAGGNILWSATDETMFTYSHKWDENRDVVGIQNMDIWVLSDTGFVHQWHIEGEKTAILEVADDFITVMAGETIEFWDVMTGALHTTRQLSDCQSFDESDTFCRHWLAHETQHVSPQPPVFSLTGNRVAVRDATQLDITQTYTIPNHIATQLNNTRAEIEWEVAPNGDVLVKFDTKVYNITQDTLIQMGAVRINSGPCRRDCRYYDIRRTWLSDDATILFGSGKAEDPDDNRFEISVLTAWDIQTGRLLYNIDGSAMDVIQFSNDGQFVFVFGNDYYFGGGRTVYNRYAQAYDARTGEYIHSGDTYAMNASAIDISPNRRFVVIHSDNSRVWGVVNP